jgi:hypothetical protein
LPDRLLDVRRELEPARLLVAGDEVVEARLVDGDLAPVEPLDLARVDVSAHHVVAEIREARAGDEADIPSPDDPEVHGGRL